MAINAAYIVLIFYYIQRFTKLENIGNINFFIATGNKITYNVKKIKNAMNETRYDS